MEDEAKIRAEALKAQLEAEGHHEEARKLGASLEGPVDKLLYGLREFCRTMLTAVEAIDPATETLAEELRTEVDRRLTRADD